MKKIILVIAIFLAGCNQLIKGQEQPVIRTNVKDGIYYTTCSGAVENWASCNNKAIKTCANGYQVVSKNENSTGTKRELTFQCKK